MQIKCKLKLSTLALRKGDANLLLISLLCICRHHRGTGELSWERKQGIAGRSWGCFWSVVDLTVGFPIFSASKGQSEALLMRTASTLHFSLYLEMREAGGSGEEDLIGVRSSFWWGKRLCWALSCMSRGKPGSCLNISDEKNPFQKVSERVKTVLHQA